MDVLDSVFARFYDRLTEPVERKGLAATRRQLLTSLDGEVLEIGAGTGANLDLYPDGVALTLTEPSHPMIARLREHLAGSGRVGTRISQAPAEELPFADASFDAVVTTLVLCSVNDLGAAAAELRRVLRRGGRLVVIEHVATPGGPSLRQRAWQPAQKILGRNCHLTRDTRTALETAGFDTSVVVDGRLPGAPASMFPAIVGVAVAV